MNIEFSDPFASQKAIARNALYQVIDPELFVNVIDLGMIYDLDFNTEGHITVTMTLTTPHCPMGDAIQNGVRNAMEACFPDRQTEINLTFNPPWGMDKVTEEGRKQLGAY
jgi:metal-sulfur cluster biosynthetic enzyme